MKQKSDSTLTITSAMCIDDKLSVTDLKIGHIIVDTTQTPPHRLWKIFSITDIHPMVSLKLIKFVAACLYNNEYIIIGDYSNTYQTIQTIENVRILNTDEVEMLFMAYPLRDKYNRDTGFFKPIPANQDVTT